MLWNNSLCHIIYKMFISVIQCQQYKLNSPSPFTFCSIILPTIYISTNSGLNIYILFPKLMLDSQPNNNKKHTKTWKEIEHCFVLHNCEAPKANLNICRRNYCWPLLQIEELTPNKRNICVETVWIQTKYCCH